MRRAAILILLLLGCLVTSTAQKPSLELTFTAIDSATHIQLDSIKVMNRTQGGDTVLYYPDTVLVLDYVVGVEEVDDKEEGLRVYQNYPNPVIESTTISIYVPEKGLVWCLITDIMGRVVCQYEEVLETGEHSFRYTPGGGQMSFFTVQWQNFRETIKMLHSTGTDKGSVSLSYGGVQQYLLPPTKSLDTIHFSYELGDDLLYIGYVSNMETGIPDTPSKSDTNYFQFATNIPCPGTPTVTYEGQVYNTIQIFSQCWLKENLNVGILIDSLESQTNNNTIEKYCYANSEDSCTLYGGLYQWDEMMAYVTYESAKGICPEGWHIPSDIEWQVLYGSVDGFYGVGDTMWTTNYLYVGEDVGLNLKSITGWADNGNGVDSFGFNALPNGTRFKDGSFNELYRYYGTIWTSTRPAYYSIAHLCRLAKFQDGINRDTKDIEWGLGVRCVMDK